MALTIIASPAELSYSRNPITLVVRLEGDEEFSDFYAICTVMDSNNAVIANLFARPDAVFNASFELSSIVNSLTSFVLPDLNALVQKVDGYTTYKYNVVQFSDGIPIADTGIITKYAIKGGAAQEKITEDLLDNISVNKRFLTWLNKAVVVADQPYYVAYLHLRDTQALSLFATIKYSDGSSRDEQISDLGDVGKYSLVYISNSFSGWHLGDFEPAKMAVYYELRVEASGPTIMAGPFRFVFADTYTPYVRTITFANSLGGFEFIQMRGNINQSIEPTSTEIVFDIGNGEYTSSLNHLIEKSGKASTGFIPKKQLQTLSDLFTSDQRYEISAQTMIKIVVSTKTKLEFNEIDNLYALTIDYTRAAKNRNYTPDATSEDK